MKKPMPFPPKKAAAGKAKPNPFGKKAAGPMPMPMMKSGGMAKGKRGC